MFDSGEHSLALKKALYLDENIRIINRALFNLDNFIQEVTAITPVSFEKLKTLIQKTRDDAKIGAMTPLQKDAFLSACKDAALQAYYQKTRETTCGDSQYTQALYPAHYTAYMNQKNKQHLYDFTKNTCNSIEQIFVLLAADISI